ncbi:hypothetical protein [Halocatena marina]|uniref:Uncharacterized protein n=1 Tax=Halocatena marina TaxID=2934937 RepID=A0ABD5YU30_9EURY|nr:hypothetical protein [Halocatena marina]
MSDLVQVTNFAGPKAVRLRVLERQSEICNRANNQVVLASYSSDCEDATVRLLDTKGGAKSIVHLS